MQDALRCCPTFDRRGAERRAEEGCYIAGWIHYSGCLTGLPSVLYNHAACLVYFHAFFLTT
jgi:hypothetical protein